MMRLDQEQGVGVGIGGGPEIHQHLVAIGVIEPVPVKVLEHPHRARPIALVQPDGGGRGAHCLGAADWDHRRARLGRGPRGEAFGSGPGEDGLRREAHVFSMEMIPVGEADVLQAVLQGVAARAPGVCPRREGVA